MIQLPHSIWVIRVILMFVFQSFIINCSIKHIHVSKIIKMKYINIGIDDFLLSNVKFFTIKYYNNKYILKKYIN
jgi:hypothetical protein